MSWISVEILLYDTDNKKAMNYAPNVPETRKKNEGRDIRIHDQHILSESVFSKKTPH